MRTWLFGCKGARWFSQGADFVVLTRAADELTQRLALIAVPQNDPTALAKA
jgi:hypothetical protein